MNTLIAVDASRRARDSRAQTALGCVRRALTIAVAACSTLVGAHPLTFVPMGIGTSAKTEDVAKNILFIHEHSGITRYVLHAPGHAVRISGYYDTEGYRGIGRRVKAIQDAVAAKGIQIGFLMGPTINVGINHPWTKVVRRNGQVRAFAACPGDPAFRKAFVEHCAAVAEECHPFLYVMEDDFCYAWDTVCLCDWHKAHPDRVMEDLYQLAAEAAKAIHRVSPQTRIGLSCPGGYREEAEWIARTLADGDKPFIRWYGTDYGFDVPMNMPGFLWTPMWAKQNLSEGMECVYEADACPNTPFYGSGTRLAASCSAMLANGFHGLWYWIGNLDLSNDDGMPPNLAAYARLNADLEAVGACAREGRPVGISTLTAPGGRLMARYGIPYKSTPGGVEIYAGDTAFEGRSNDEIRKILSGRMLLDGDAASALTKLGFADLLGARAYPRAGQVDFVGECVRIDDSRVPSTFHQNYGLDGSDVLRLESARAEEVSYYYGKSVSNRVQSAVTRYANNLGGRVVVLATAFKNATPTNLLNYRKRALILNLIAWLGGEGAIPVRTDREVNMMLFANEDEAKTRLFVHGTQLSCDALDATTLVVAPPYCGGRVEVVENGRWKGVPAAWQGNRVTIPKTLHLYDSLAVRIRRPCLPSFAAVERDIVIYGSSPAAISAAVQAKRMGKTCVVVSPETRIGGLTTGGLGQTDIGNKKCFGGLALDFYRDVAKYYDEPSNWKWQKPTDYKHVEQGVAVTKGSMWVFEPSAALKILEGWEKRDGLRIVRGKRLDRSEGKVKVEGEGEQRRIKSFLTEDGTEFRGKMFVDATYEGDLMAAAGVSYTVGREANQVYGETLSGTQVAQARYHQFLKGVDPYVVKGDKSSGLLPNVEPGPIEADGSGDRRVQAYCFRMCLTDVPENRIPFAKPAGYDARDYELLLRNFEAGDTGLPWINSQMPNRKTDTNNRTAFSTDFIGRNWKWAEASYAERDAIRAEHLKYQQGLMWTLANHPRVPEKIRTEVARWGLCKDEFADGLGGGWQTQLYVREARRMVGACVMTEHHCRGRKTSAHPIAMGAYSMDSHNVRRYVGADGFVHNEGDVEVGSAPYGIDYGAIVPKRGECANLFVPVCLSASHIAFGSIRMEPVFFALGQAAATAAAQAIDAHCAVQDLAYGPLADRLRADGQVFVLDEPPETVTR